MLKLYDVIESALDSKDFEAEAIYVCNDTGNFYIDSIATNTRKKLSNEVIIVATESARSAILAPIPEKIYCVIESGGMYLYYNGTWVKFGSRPQIHFENIIATAGTALILTDNRIIAGDTAVFVPDISVADLEISSVCTCAAGQVTVTVTADYDIPGSVIVN